MCARAYYSIDSSQGNTTFWSNPDLHVSSSDFFCLHTVRPADSSTLVVPLVIGLVGGIIIIGAIAAVAIMLVWIYKG